MVIRIPSRLRIIIPSRIIEGRLIIEIDTTPLSPIWVLSKIGALFCVMFFIFVYSLAKIEFDFGYVK
jgi:hypothetical protein